MPTPLNRSKLLPARGTKANLEASLADLLEGEFCYATDENIYYQVAGGFLTPVNQPQAGAMTVMTSDVQTDEGAAVRAGREVVPPDLPPGYTELNNQREVNWWMHREVENVANRTTVLETSQRQQDERIYALEQAPTPEVPGGDWDKDLEALATKEELAYVNEQLQAADAAIQEAYQKDDQHLAERIRVVENDYTTTDDFNNLFRRTKDNASAIEANASVIAKHTGEIQDLQEGFDAAVIAAQEGAENLEIELQSYVKKSELPEAPPEVNLAEVAYATARVSEKELAVWAGQKQVAPEQDRGGRIGWAYRSKGDGTKAHWNLWSQDRDSFRTLRLKDVYAYMFLISGSGKEQPLLQVYTQRKNDGNDAASTYRSRISYKAPAQDRQLVNLTLLTTGPDTPLYSNLQRVQMGRDEIGRPTMTEAEAEVQPAFSTGPGEEDEVITKVVLTTNSAAAEGDYDFVLSSFMLHSRNGIFDTRLEFGPQEIPEIPEIPEVSLEGYATEEFVESALENYASTGELGAAEIRIGTNESDIKDLQEAVEAIVIPEVPEAPEIDLSPYAYTEYVDRADGLLHERIVKLEDAPPPQAQIDWENLPELK